MHSGPERLTPREQEVLRLVKTGLTNKQVARELGIGLDTVKRHLHTIFLKLGVSNRTEAVVQWDGREHDGA